MPRPQRAAKDDAIAGIEKHLRGAASVALLLGRRVFFEDEADITNARSHIGNLPRFDAGSLKVKRRRKIPRYASAFLQRARRVAETVKLKLGIKCGFADNLNDDLFVKKLRLELMVEISGKHIDLSLVRHIRKQRSTTAENLCGGFFGHQCGWRGIFRTTDLRSSVPMNDFRHDRDPKVGPPVVGAKMLKNCVLEELNGGPNGVVAVGIAYEMSLLERGIVTSGLVSRRMPKAA